MIKNIVKMSLINLCIVGSMVSVACARSNVPDYNFIPNQNPYLNSIQNTNQDVYMYDQNSLYKFDQRSLKPSAAVFTLGNNSLNLFGILGNSIFNA